METVWRDLGSTFGGTRTFLLHELSKTNALNYPKTYSSPYTLFPTLMRGLVTTTFQPMLLMQPLDTSHHRARGSFFETILLL